MLHGSRSTYARTAAAFDQAGNPTIRYPSTQDGPQLLEMFQCPARAEDGREATALVFADGGSTLSLIRNEFAARLGLQGTHLEYFMRVVGHDYTLKESQMYTFCLVDRQGRGNRRHIRHRPHPRPDADPSPLSRLPGRNVRTAPGGGGRTPRDEQPPSTPKWGQGRRGPPDDELPTRPPLYNHRLPPRPDPCDQPALPRG